MGFFQNYDRLVGMKITLAVTERDKSVTLSTLRSEEKVPAVVYGSKQEAISITISEKDFDKVRKEVGESTIIELVGLKSSIEVLIKAVEFSPVKQQILHVDFYVLEMDKDITTHVQLNFIGEDSSENALQGILTKVLHEVEVTCRPNVLPSHIDVDVSSLVLVGDKIHVKDLIVGKGVVINAAEDDSVVIVGEKSHAPVEETETVAVDMDSIEVEKKGKAEVEEVKK